MAKGGPALTCPFRTWKFLQTSLSPFEKRHPLSLCLSDYLSCPWSRATQKRTRFENGLEVRDMQFLQMVKNYRTESSGKVDFFQAIWELWWHLQSGCRISEPLCHIPERTLKRMQNENAESTDQSLASGQGEITRSKNQSRVQQNGASRNQASGQPCPWPLSNCRRPSSFCIKILHPRIVSWVL